MPEHDEFDVRLTAAVRGLASGAETRVDAVEVADRAMGRPKASRGSWRTATVQVPVGVLAIGALVIGALAWTAGGHGVGGPVGGPVPTPAAAPVQSPTALPTPALRSPAHVTGSAVWAIQSRGTATTAGGTTRTTGIAIDVVDDVDDRRVAGSGRLSLSVEGSSSLGFAAGSLHLENALGAWEGHCSGAIWGTLPIGQLECRLTGSGAYAGLVYYRSAQFTAIGSDVNGMILPTSLSMP